MGPFLFYVFWLLHMNYLHRTLLQAIVDHDATQSVLHVYGKLKRWLITLIPGREIWANLNDLRCRPVGHPWIRIKSTPQYRDLKALDSCDYWSPYAQYLNQHGVEAGYPAHYTKEYFHNLALKLTYLAAGYERHHIIVVRCGKHYRILDGVHRSAILANHEWVRCKVRLVPTIWVWFFRGWKEFMEVRDINYKSSRQHSPNKLCPCCNTNEPFTN